MRIQSSPSMLNGVMLRFRVPGSGFRVRGSRFKVRRSAFIAAVLLVCASGAYAQDVPPQDVPLEDKPIGRFVADVRGAFPKFKQDPNIASGINVQSTNLPARAFGFVVGAHVYPARMGPITLGLGGEMMVAARNRTAAAATEGGTAGPTVHTRMSSVTPQISFNFGKRQGWSYISGGIGRTAFTAERTDAPLPKQSGRSQTYNYGGGARWFSKKHVAFTVDFRFYAISAQEKTAERPAVSRMTLTAFSVGVAFK
jgi:hypothetical protein